ncbi:protein DDI1-like [Vairimorpha necatrix]|uniref:Protein DDI1-like n=1 Tax=Vairimorpha necatrix TaxID=6039 RepID=A0AAX4JFA7_9MICR
MKLRKEKKMENSTPLNHNKKILNKKHLKQAGRGQSHIGDNNQNLKTHYEEDAVEKNENAKEFLEQFIDVEYEWTSEKLVKRAKSLLKFKAEKWFNFQETTGLIEFSDFKKRFKKKYCIEQKTEEKDEVDKRGGKQILLNKAIKKHKMLIPGYLTDKLQALDTWEDLIEFAEGDESAINRELRKFLSSKNMNKEKRFNDTRKDVKKDTQSPTERILSISAAIKKNSRDCRLRVNLTTEKYELVALIDTEAGVSLMKESVAKKLELKIKRNKTSVKGITGKTKTSGDCNVDIEHNGEKTTKMPPMKDMEEDMILGVVEIRKFKIGSMIDNSENESYKKNKSKFQQYIQKRRKYFLKLREMEAI